MMFAGLTSAFIVKSNQTNWITVKLPTVFWYSTAVIMLSSITVQSALRSFKQREMSRYRLLIGHGNAEADGQWLLDRLHGPNVTDTRLLPLGSALGVHGGPGTLCVGVQCTHTG